MYGAAEAGGGFGSTGASGFFQEGLPRMHLPRDLQFHPVGAKMCLRLVDSLCVSGSACPNEVDYIGKRDVSTKEQ